MNTDKHGSDIKPILVLSVFICVYLWLIHISFDHAFAIGIPRRISGCVAGAAEIKMSNVIEANRI